MLVPLTNEPMRKQRVVSKLDFKHASIEGLWLLAPAVSVVVGVSQLRNVRKPSSIVFAMGDNNS